MIQLVPTRLHWVQDDGNDDPADLCAHSPVSLLVDGVPLITPEAGDFTVNAAAIYLLRTLDRNHTPESPVGEQLFPCCGHAMHDTGGDDVLIIGCPKGVDLSVKHSGSDVKLTTATGESFQIPFLDWHSAVLKFSGLVKQFYERSLAKSPGKDDAAGFAKMMAEWERRMSPFASD